VSKGQERRTAVAYFISRLNTASFIVPIYPLYLSTLGISVSLIVLVSNLYLILTLTFKPIVAYFIADRISRKLSWILALLSFIVGLSIYIVANSLREIVIAELIYNIGAVFRGQNPEIIVFERLRDQSLVTRALFQGELESLITIGLFSIIGGFVAEYNLKLPFMLSLATLLFMLVTSVILIEDVKGDVKRFNSNGTKGSFKTSLKTCIKSLGKRRALPLITMSLMIALIRSIITPLMPLLLKNAGFSIILISFTYASVGMMLVMITRFYRDRFSNIIFNPLSKPIMLMILSIAPLMSLLGGPLMLIASFLVLTLIPQLLRPLIFTQLQEFTSHELRSTFNSLISSIVSFTTFMVVSIISLLNLSIEVMLMLATIISFILTSSIFLLEYRV
jgi:DHA1 family multidrug resistance protein-like MFS transporter